MHAVAFMVVKAERATEKDRILLENRPHEIGIDDNRSTSREVSSGQFLKGSTLIVVSEFGKIVKIDRKRNVIRFQDIVFFWSQEINCTETSKMYMCIYRQGNTSIN